MSFSEQVKKVAQLFLEWIFQNTFLMRFRREFSVEVQRNLISGIKDRLVENIEI